MVTKHRPVEVEAPETHEAPEDQDPEEEDDDAQMYEEGNEEGNEEALEEPSAAGAGPMEDSEGFDDKHFLAAGHPMCLETCIFEKANQQSVNSWIKGNLGKGYQKIVDEKTGELFKTLEKAPPGQRIPVDRLAVQWGLSVSLAGRLNDKALAKLICACTMMEEDLEE